MEFSTLTYVQQPPLSTSKTLGKIHHHHDQQQQQQQHYSGSASAHTHNLEERVGWSAGLVTMSCDPRQWDSQHLAHQRSGRQALSAIYQA